MQTGDQVDFVLSLPLYILGRSTQADLENKLCVDFDPTLSREHALLQVSPTKVLVKAAKNRHPLFFNGTPQEQFSLGVGESFSSGQTAFALGLEEPAPQTMDLFVSADRIEQAQQSNPREILAALLQIQPLLAEHHQPLELFGALLPLLQRVVPSATALLAISVGADGQHQVIQSVGSKGCLLQASETLLRRCLNENQAIYHIWQDVPESSGPTAFMGASWALAAPVVCTPDSYVLYALGMEKMGRSSALGPSELDRSVLAMIAGLLGKHLQGQRASVLARQVEAERSQRLLSENLRNLTRSVASSLDAKVVLEQLLAYLGPVVNYDQGYGFLKINGEFHPYAVRGNQTLVLDRLPSNSPVHFLLKQHQHESFVLSAHSPEAEALGLQLPGELLLLPLMSQKEVQGLTLLCKEGGFSDSQVEVASSFAAQVGMAIHNARLFSRVRNQAIYDELTGLANRRQFFNLAQQLWKSPEFSIILFDIDRFKSINDTHGHDLGDLALKHVAAVCRRALRECEQLARLGGEEFALAVPVPLQVAESLAERLRQSLEAAPCQASPTVSLTITVSLGVACKTEDVAHLEQLLKRADQALYAAKAGGRNRVEVF